ncbi:tyrosine-type recombinase/integrase [Tenacibaculum xiamenense]|uniref:tyrosine-type recombinase/integrase n=1 Tax=Tenacibaculum xiamenense TaxID=1261553 RepID=UPI003894526E
MLLENCFTRFKRYALYEKEITPKCTKEIISATRKLFAHIATQELRAITTTDVRDYLYLKKEERLWSARTFRNQRQYLKTFFDYCLENQFIKENPVSKINKPKLPKTLPRFLTKNQLQKIILHTEIYPWRYEKEKVRNRALIYTFIHTGMRLNELLNLKIEDINMQEKEIVVKKGKGRKERIIPIHNILFSVLQSYLIQRKKSSYRSEYFFESLRVPTKMTAKTIHTICRKISKKSGEYFTPHNLRHAFARSLVNEGVGLYLVKELLGHTSISTTEIYLSVSKESLRKSFCHVALL